jgi:hypothetical protein
MHAPAMAPGNVFGWLSHARARREFPMRFGTNRLRETTPTENPRSSKVVGIEHKANNLVLENLKC